MTKKFLAPAPPGGRYGRDPVFRPHYSSKSIFGPADHIVAGTKNFLYHIWCVSEGTWGWSQKFLKNLENWRFWAKIRRFSSNLWKIIKQIALDRIFSYLLNPQLKGRTFDRKNKKMLLILRSSVIWQRSRPTLDAHLMK